MFCPGFIMFELPLVILVVMGLLTLLEIKLEAGAGDICLGLIHV